MATPHLFPSPSLPGPTPFTFTTPDGWVATPSRLALVSVRPEADEPGTELLVNWSRVPLQHDLTVVAARSVRFLRQIDPEPRIAISRIGALGGMPAFIRIAEVTPRDAEHDMSHLHVAFFGPFEGQPELIELFELVGIARTTHPERVRDFNAIVESFRFVSFDTPTQPAAEAAGTRG
ncbi:MAG TPA: hypothetical protein VK866_13730 [Acidimicrobiales bacterium]|nr:hypothetical protein [Acidimicrobiales bacterium]